jgi:four helix bundle protein
MSFLAYDLSLDLIRNLRGPLEIVRRHDAALARQGRDALNSVALNLNEGSGRNGGDRQQHFAIAFGSLREVAAVLDIAAAHGWFAAPPYASDRDRLGGILWRLTRR